MVDTQLSQINSELQRWQTIRQEQYLKSQSADPGSSDEKVARADMYLQEWEGAKQYADKGYEFGAIKNYVGSVVNNWADRNSALIEFNKTQPSPPPGYENISNWNQLSDIAMREQLPKATFTDIPAQVITMSPQQSNSKTLSFDDVKSRLSLKSEFPIPSTTNSTTPLQLAKNDFLQVTQTSSTPIERERGEFSSIPISPTINRNLSTPGKNVPDVGVPFTVLGEQTGVKPVWEINDAPFSSGLQTSIYSTQVEKPSIVTVMPFTEGFKGVKQYEEMQIYKLQQLNKLQTAFQASPTDFLNTGAQGKTTKRGYEYSINPQEYFTSVNRDLEKEAIIYSEKKFDDLSFSKKAGSTIGEMGIGVTQMGISSTEFMVDLTTGRGFITQGGTGKVSTPSTNVIGKSIQESFSKPYEFKDPYSKAIKETPTFQTSYGFLEKPVEYLLEKPAFTAQVGLIAGTLIGGGIATWKASTPLVKGGYSRTRALDIAMGESLQTIPSPFNIRLPDITKTTTLVPKIPLAKGQVVTFQTPMGEEKITSIGGGGAGYVEAKNFYYEKWRPSIFEGIIIEKGNIPLLSGQYIQAIGPYKTIQTESGMVKTEGLGGRKIRISQDVPVKTPTGYTTDKIVTDIWQKTISKGVSWKPTSNTEAGVGSVKFQTKATQTYVGDFVISNKVNYAGRPGKARSFSVSMEKETTSTPTKITKYGEGIAFLQSGKKTTVLPYEYRSVTPIAGEGGGFDGSGGNSGLKSVQRFMSKIIGETFTPINTKATGTFKSPSITQSKGVVITKASNVGASQSTDSVTKTMNRVMQTVSPIVIETRVTTETPKTTNITKVVPTTTFGSGLITDVIPTQTTKVTPVTITPTVTTPLIPGMVTPITPTPTTTVPIINRPTPWLMELPVWGNGDIGANGDLKRDYSKRKKRKKAYQPSVAAWSLGIVESPKSSKKNIFSGFEIRPLFKERTMKPKPIKVFKDIFSSNNRNVDKQINININNNKYINSKLNKAFSL